MAYEDKPLDYDMQDGLRLNESSRNDLNETARWAKFLAILGFIGVGVMVLSALAVTTMVTAMPGMDASPFPTSIFGLFYIGFAILYFLPILYLYRFASHTQEAMRTSDSQELEVALANIKSHYKFIGILAAIVLGFYALGMILAIFMGLTESLMG